MRVSEQRAQQVAGPVWVTVWAWPFIGPALAVLHGQVHPLVPAALGLAVFLVLYVVVILGAFNDPQRRLPRHRAIMLAALAATGLALSVVYVGQPDGWLTPLSYVTMCGGAVLLKPSRFLTWLTSWCLATVAVGYSHGLSGDEIGTSVFTTVMGSLLVFVIRQMAGFIYELRTTQRALADTAVAQERLRFSRDLHDLLGHTLSLMVVKAELARRLAPTDGAAAAREAGDIETIGRRALAEVREAVTGYRDRTLTTELDGARSALVDAGIQAVVRETGTPLPGAVDEAFAWAVREGVTNVIRHSGAGACEIDVSRDGETATLTIRDDGIAVAADGIPLRGNGLRGLAERVDALGGTLTAGPQPGGGFRVTALVPAQVGPTGPDRPGALGAALRPREAVR